MEDPVVVERDSTQEIKPKMHFTGTVLKTSLAGAVVDIGSEKHAVIHVSQIVAPENQPIKSVRDVLQEGQQIEVWVRKIKDERIELTMNKPLDLEWRDVKKEMVVKGKVVRIESFGVFLDIGAERPGLIHISELAHGYVRTPGDVVKEGDELEAQVIDVNKKKKQIKLSLKALQPEPIHEVQDHPAEQKKERPRRPKKSNRRSKDEGYNENLDELASMTNGDNASEAEPTAMEIAMREAMERAKARKQDDKVKKAKATVSDAQEEILARTLEHKSANS
jgi:small subunit ribosomal protein S1